MTQPKYFLTNENGDRIAVILDMEEYQKLLDAYEELESIREFDFAKASGDESISLEEVIAQHKQD